MAGTLKPTGKKARAGRKSRAKQSIENSIAHHEGTVKALAEIHTQQQKDLQYLYGLYEHRYTEEFADAVCDEIANGNSLNSICKMEGMPGRSVVMRWRIQHEDFDVNFARAKEWSTEALLEDILDIADDGTNDYVPDNYMEGRTPGYRVDGENINRSKLRVETRFRLMGLLKPRKYGAKVDMTTNGKDMPTPILGVMNVEINPNNIMDSIESDM